MPVRATADEVLTIALPSGRRPTAVRHMRKVTPRLTSR
jgi:hypothetical protein